MFRFSIREISLITLCVALILGWWIDHRAQALWRARAGAMQWHMEWEGHDVNWDTTHVIVTTPGTQVPPVHIGLADYAMPSDPAKPWLRHKSN